MSRKRFKLLVKPSDSSLQVLRYLDDNIKEINSMGVQMVIEKLTESDFDKELVTKLNRKGITRLPTLIAPDGKIFTGMKTIKNLFEKNIRSKQMTRRIAPAGNNAEMGNNPDLESFYQRELFKEENGVRKPRTDPDDPDDESGDIERRVAEYNKNMPAHRRHDAVERERRPTPITRQRPQDVGYIDENIADDDDDYQGYDLSPHNPGSVQLESTGNQNDDHLDDMMINAWMNNNPMD